MDTSSSKTYYSGYKAGSVVLVLCALALASPWAINFEKSMKMVHDAGFAVLLAGILIGLAFMIIVNQCFYGIHSLAFTSKKLTVRRGLYIRRMAIQTIRAMKLTKSVSTYKGTTKTRYELWVYFQSPGDELLAQPVFLSAFPRKVQQAFFSAFFAENSDITINSELYKYAKGTRGSAISNPVEKISLHARSSTIQSLLGLESQFSEATLFLMAVSFLALFALQRDAILIDLMRVLESTANTRKGNGGIVMIVFFMILGLFFSLYHIVKRGKKSTSARAMMIYFGVGMSASAGMFSAFKTWNSPNIGWIAWALSLWSILYGILLFASLTAKSDIEKRVQNRDAKLHEVLFGLIGIGIIIYINDFYYHVYWAVTFCACIAYVTLMNSTVQSWFPDFHHSMPTLGVRFPEFRKKPKNTAGSWPLKIFLVTVLFSIFLLKWLGVF